MLVKRFSICFLALLVGILLAACSDREDEQPTMMPTEVNYSWEAGPVLISLQTASDYPADYDYAWSLTPELVVYSDGRVVGSTTEYIDSERIKTYWSGQTTQDEMCYLLGQIDGLGFFDYQESEYVKPGIDHLNTTQIVVQGWKSRTITVNGLESVGVNEGYAPPALAETYRLLSSIQPPNVVPYQPERIALLISRVEEEIPAELWPLAEPDLSELIQGLEQREEREFIFGNEAVDVLSDLFAGKWFKLFKSQGETYKVVIRPLFPLEIREETDAYGRLVEFESSPRVDLTCSNQALPASWITAAAPTPQPIESDLAGENAPLEYVDSIGAWDEPGQLDIIGSFVSTPQGDLLVADISNYRLIRFAHDGTVSSEMIPSSIFAIDMVFLPDGNLVMLDSSPNTIQIYSPEGVLLQTIDSWPPQDGSENVYADETLDFVATDPDGKIFTGERSGNRVIILNGDGSLSEIWKGPEGESFESVQDIAMDSIGNLFVVDYDQGRVVKRSPSGEIQVFLIEGNQISVRPDGAFYINNGLSLSLYGPDGEQRISFELEGYISDLKVAPDGLGVIVQADLVDHPGIAFHHFDEVGNLVRSFGTTLPLPGQFNGHTAFSVSAVGDVWVLAKIQVGPDYWTTQNVLQHLGRDYSLLNSFDKFGGNQFSCLDYSLAALSDQTVLVADPCKGIILHLNSRGEVLYEWGENGRGSGQFNLIYDIALAPDEDSFYVVDSGNNLVNQFGLGGQKLSEWDNNNLGVEVLSSMDISEDGTFFLIDGASHEIVVKPQVGSSIRWLLPRNHESPFDIAIDENRQRIYIGGTDVNLYVFDWFGNFLGFFGYWDGSGVMVNVGQEGNLYRSAGFREIQIYRPIE